MKLLSVDAAYPDAPREGIRRILEQVGQIMHFPRERVTGMLVGKFKLNP